MSPELVRGLQERAALALPAQHVEDRADRMYLQVERDNIPALHLYERTGFSEICGYHYRTRS